MPRAARILVVGHDPLLGRSLTRLFKKHGYDVDRASNAAAACALLDHRRPDLIVLDLEVPELDGPEVCRRVRQVSDVPIIVLSDQSPSQDEVSLEQGADDYVSKPFNAEELVARVRTALRRVASLDDTGLLDLGALAIDFDRRRIRLGGTEIRLTPGEFKLLVFLSRNPNRVLPRRTILTAIWGKPGVNHPERLWALIARLRKKLEPDPERPRYLLSDPWVGYRLVTGPDQPGASTVKRAARQRSPDVTE